MIDGAEEYRVEPGSGRNAGDQTNIFAVDGGRRSKLKSWRDANPILGSCSVLAIRPPLCLIAGSALCKLTVYRITYWMWYEDTESDFVFHFPRYPRKNNPWPRHRLQGPTRSVNYSWTICLRYVDISAQNSIFSSIQTSINRQLLHKLHDAEQSLKS